MGYLSDPGCIQICKWVEKKIGLLLTMEKKYLVEHRLEPVATMNGFSSIDELIEETLKGKNKLLEQQVIDSLVTNETYFFRDPESFVDLKEIIKQLYVSKKDKKLCIWSAACSTGQEIYSIALTLHDLNLDWKGWTLQLVGTDISEAVLNKARNGIYNHFEVQRGLHITQLIKWFTQVNDSWQIKSPFMGSIEFKSNNLLTEPVPFTKIDLLFLRNVLIYFDNPVKKQLLRKMKESLGISGYLFLGGTETAFYLNDEVRRLKEFKTPVYQFKDLNASSGNEKITLYDSIKEQPQKDHLGNLIWPSL